MESLFILLVNLIHLYEIIIIIRIILSWVDASPYNPIVRFLCQLTDPVLDAVRRTFPFLAAGGFDFSPILVLFLLQMTKSQLLMLAHRL